MKISGKWKKGVSLALAAAILMPAIPGHAAKQTFTDVPRDAWAYKYIEKMAAQGVLQGKGDGKFYPRQNLTFMESMAAMARLTKPTASEKAQALKKYDSLLKELNVKEDWEKEALSLALDRGIVFETELKNAKTQFHKPLQKVAVSSFLARAAGLEDKANSLEAVFLDYKDVDKINVELRKYVKVLRDAGILDKDGDGDGNFNPTEAVRREILSTMLSRANEYMVKNPVKDKPGSEEAPEGIGTKKAKINRITNEIGRQFLVIEEGSREESFVIKDTTRISINGRSASVSSLARGQEATLQYDRKDKSLLSITIVDENAGTEPSKPEEVKEKFIEVEAGVVKSYNQARNTLSIDYNDRGKIRSTSYDLASNVRIDLEGREARLSDLKEGDFVRLDFRREEVSQIEALPREISISGSIEDIDQPRELKDKGVLLTIKRSKKEEFAVIANSKTDIRRDKEEVGYKDLRETDELEVKAKYSLEDQAYVASSIRAEKVDGEYSGYVIEISNRIGSNPIVVVRLKETDKEREFELSNKAYISVDGRRADSLPANPGYEINLLVEGGDLIVEAYVDTVSMEESLMGTIVETEDDYITIRPNRESKNVRVYYSRNTKVRDRDGENYRPKDLIKGDIVNIIGVYKGANFTASSIEIRN